MKDQKQDRNTCPVCDFPLEPPVADVSFDRTYTVHRDCAACLSNLEAELQKLNQEYAVVHNRDGRTRVVRLADGEPMSVSGFRDAEIANRRVRILRRGRLVECSIVAPWLAWENRGVLIATAEIDEDAKTLDLIFWGAQ